MEGGRDAFFGMAAAPWPSSSFLGSATTGSGGPLMLSFSSNDDAGLGLSSGASSMQELFSSVRGPFTPTQWMELEHQALIYKYFAANAPVPSSLLLPIRRSLKPWSCFGSGSLGWPHFRPASTDVEPSRCRRTDGKKWRCSRDAVADEKYCERHLNRVRYRSRKHVEGQKATPTIAGPAMAVSTVSHTVAWQQQMKSSAASASHPLPRQSNRTFLDKHNGMQGHISVSNSMDSFAFSITQSFPNSEKVVLSEVGLQHDYDQTHHVHEAGILAEKSKKLQESQLLVCRETIDDGPLGEVFRSKACQQAYADMVRDEWAANQFAFCKGNPIAD